MLRDNGLHNHFCTVKSKHRLPSLRDPRSVLRSRHGDWDLMTECRSDDRSCNPRLSGLTIGARAQTSSQHMHRQAEVCLPGT